MHWNTSKLQVPKRIELVNFGEHYWMLCVIHADFNAKSLQFAKIPFHASEIVITSAQPSLSQKYNRALTLLNDSIYLFTMIQLKHRVMVDANMMDWQSDVCSRQDILGKDAIMVQFRCSRRCDMDCGKLKWGHITSGSNLCRSDG